MTKPGIYKRLFWTIPAFIIILSSGTLGYWYISQNSASILDCFYMTFITISTIGFGEIIDLSKSPSGRLFTILIALAGIGTVTYTLSTFTALVVSGELQDVYRRKKMMKKVASFNDHFIVCGIEGVGFYIVKELYETRRPHIVVDIDRLKLEKFLETFDEKVFIIGDAMESNVLLDAGIERAKGLFAVTGDDNQNLVISLTAKQLNPDIKVVARCRQMKNVEKIKKAGADSIVSPAFIGGLRMASEMFRPTAVSFLDEMLRDKRNLRVEEIIVPQTHKGVKVADLHTKALLLAIRSEEKWIYNPNGEYHINPGEALIFMATPKEREELEDLFG